VGSEIVLTPPELPTSQLSRNLDANLFHMFGCLDTFGERSGFDSGFRLDLEHIALTSNHLVQHGIDEESDEETGDETGHDDYSERPLSI
jgi:hypothetical protein